MDTYYSIVNNSVSRYGHLRSSGKIEPLCLEIKKFDTIDGYWNSTESRYSDFNDITTYIETYNLTKFSPTGPFERFNSTQARQYVHNMKNFKVTFYLESLEIDFLGTMPYTWQVVINYKMKFGTGVFRSSVQVYRHISEAGSALAGYLAIDILVLLISLTAAYLHFRSLVREAYYYRKIKDSWQKVPKYVKSDYTNKQFDWKELGVSLKMRIFKVWPFWGVFSAAAIVASSSLDIFTRFGSASTGNLSDLLLGIGLFFACVNL